jgi:hypothetical protein
MKTTRIALLLAAMATFSIAASAAEAETAPAKPTATEAAALQPPAWPFSDEESAALITMIDTAVKSVGLNGVNAAMVLVPKIATSRAAAAAYAMQKSQPAK